MLVKAKSPRKFVCLINGVIKSLLKNYYFATFCTIMYECAAGNKVFTFDALLKHINHVCNIMSKCIFEAKRFKNCTYKV